MMRLERVERVSGIAENRGGKLLVAYKDHVDIECQYHGPFRQKYRESLDGAWCQKCKFEKLRSLYRMPYKDARANVEARGWIVLTPESEFTNRQNLLIACPTCGNATRNKYEALMTGRGCRVCSAKRGERITRVILERIYGTAFPTKKPSWLQRSSGTRLELDGYSEELGIAFEYQGEQHYGHRVKFNFSDTELSDLQERDKIKHTLCAEQGVLLIVVPYFSTKMYYDSVQIIQHIEDAIVAAGASLPRWDRAACDPLKETMTSDDSSRLDELHQIATNENATCESQLWLGVKHKYKFRCACGKKFARGGWDTLAKKSKMRCRSCAGKAARNGPGHRHLIPTIERLRAFAVAKNGTCLSPDYITSKCKYEWKCHIDDHPSFFSAWNRMDSGHSGRGWCPKCGFDCMRESLRAIVRTPREQIVTLQMHAASKNGLCLSANYTNSQTKYEWKCHVTDHPSWLASWSNVKSKGSWCNWCAAKTRHVNRHARISSEEARRR